MNRARLQILLPWLLPLLALRAIIPAGFMLSPSATGLHLALCSSVAGQAMPLDSGATHAGHESHIHHAPAAEDGGAEHREHQAHERSICPYAVAGTGHTPAIPYIAAEPATATFVLEFASDPDLKSAPVLIDRIRGPPLV